LLPLLLAAGCLRAPDRPSDDAGGVDAGSAGSDCPSTMSSAMSSSLASVIVVPAGSGRSRLVRAGLWDGVQRLVLTEPGPGFNPRCADQVIGLADTDGKGDVLAIAPAPGGRYLVVRGGAHPVALQLVSVSEPTSQPFVATGDATPSLAGHGIVAIEPTANKILFGTHVRLWTVDLPSLMSGFLSDVSTAIGDDEAVVVGALAGDPPWAVLGRRSLYRASTTAPPSLTPLVPVLSDASTTSCMNDLSSCPVRIGRSLYAEVPDDAVNTAISIARSQRTIAFLRRDGQTMNLISPLDAATAPGLRDAALVADTDSPPFIVLGEDSDLGVTRLVDSNASTVAEWNDADAATLDQVVVGSFLGDAERQAVVLSSTSTATRCVELTGARTGMPCAR